MFHWRINICSHTKWNRLGVSVCCNRTKPQRKGKRTQYIWTKNRYQDDLLRYLHLSAQKEFYCVLHLVRHMDPHVLIRFFFAYHLIRQKKLERNEWFRFELCALAVCTIKRLPEKSKPHIGNYMTYVMDLLAGKRAAKLCIVLFC